MPTDKVKEFIKKLGVPKLTKAQVAIIKDHHEYHGDKKIKIIGALPGGGVFIRCISHLGHSHKILGNGRECDKDMSTLTKIDGPLRNTISFSFLAYLWC